ncbi:MAG: zinc ribbon domain-containing protein [Anaerolineales bacterium]|nr:zinc ribbon domain-containing protein [Anaerolineales bacterium]
MKCVQCGLENKEDEKFCVSCGKPIPRGPVVYCTACGIENRREAKNCEDCGAPLVSSSAPPPPPLQQEFHPQPKKRRRLNPLLLVLLLLILLLLILLISCCCLLLTFDLVEPPASVAAIVNRFIEPVRKFLPAIPAINDDDGNGRGNAGEAPFTCVNFSGRLEAADLSQNTTCIQNSNACFIDFLGINDLQDIGVNYSWNDGSQRKATCEQTDDFTRCYFSRDHAADRVDYWIFLDDCLEKFGYSDGWLKDSEEEKSGDGGEVVDAPLSTAPCCEILNISGAKYYRDPPEVGRMGLFFKINFDDCKPISGEDILSGKVYIGPGQTEFWTDVECYDDLDADNTIACESPGNIEQKKSGSRLVLESDNCEWEALFQSPFYSAERSEEEES